MKPLRININSNINTEVISSEEVLGIIEDYKATVTTETSQEAPRLPRACKVSSIKSTTAVIGSMDVRSLYPSCKAKETGDHVKRLFRANTLNFEAINTQALLKYLSLTVNRTNTNLDDFIPIPKGTTTLKSWLREDNNSQFHPPTKSNHELTEADYKVLIGECVAQGINVVI